MRIRTKKRIESSSASLLSRRDEFSLRPWTEVARLYSERTGEKISRSRAFQIGHGAIRKIRAALGQG